MQAKWELRFKKEIQVYVNKKMEEPKSKTEVDFLK